MQAQEFLRSAVESLDGKYGPATEYTSDEAFAVETVMVAASLMRNQHGKRLPSHVPTAVALAIVRALKEKENA